MKPFVVDGMPQDKAALAQHREYLIAIRDESIKQSCLADAFELSVIIAIFHHLIEVTDE